MDGCIASLDVLPEIADAVGDKLDIREFHLPLHSEPHSDIGW